ncbi:alpha-keto acid decarboxylase family protein [Anthocerotibacter panamensis]|uniref:alpha-keto acid decarboxylase family protein n=1 Tax=Anthocerotibacter panamensis TaxID=2857077 RepID=UPI001C403309|nr:thiamine pyrophosphate-binding protein [Anthocerotibacter panamensis]
MTVAVEVSTQIADYLIQQLYELGVRHVFGVPGDYVLGFFKAVEQSRLQIINTCDEQGAGFAADAYARVRGLGVVAITYGVGGLKIANPTAGAFAEKSPVIVISGAPSMSERGSPLLHHMVRDFDTQRKVFEQLTVAVAALNNPETALAEIDRVLAMALRYRRPVYLELPRDLVNAPGPTYHRPQREEETSDPGALQEALHEAVEWINRAQQPVILAGEELHRFGLQAELWQLIESTNIPVAATILGKSVFPETHPRYMGVYEGAMGIEATRAYVEASDCLILLGALLTDINLGIFTAHLDPNTSIYASSEKLAIRHHVFEGVRLPDFVRGLIQADITRQRPGVTPRPVSPSPFVPQAGQRVTVQRLFQRLNAFLTDETIVIADPGDALFGGTDLFICGQTRFLAPAYYASMGFAVPAALGAQMADPTLRPLVLVGDGAFQMTGMELSTIARYGLNPIVVVLNNRGYGTERPITDGCFNDVLLWNFHRVPEVLGRGRGFEIWTEDELDEALRRAYGHTHEFCILNVHLEVGDYSQALQRMTKSLAERMT